MCQMKLIKRITHYFLQNHFNINFHLHLGLPSGIPKPNCTHLPPPLRVLHAQTTSSLQCPQNSKHYRVPRYTTFPSPLLLHPLYVQILSSAPCYGTFPINVSPLMWEKNYASIRNRWNYCLVHALIFTFFDRLGDKLYGSKHSPKLACLVSRWMQFWFVIAFLKYFTTFQRIYQLHLYYDFVLQFGYEAKTQYILNSPSL